VGWWIRGTGLAGPPRPPAPGGKSSCFSYVDGYWLPKPACQPLIVRIGTHQAIVHIGLGTPCPGQKGPQGPSVD
jgi:hypothetical protein